ncbi:MAG: SDR family oxidoreductase [Clostridia bacterium]|nr:SDR family oxidoreductase [Clostridia bacterium]
MKRKILLTGVTGYIGKRLLPVLVEQGHIVYCLVRDKDRFVVNENLKEQVQVFEADLHDKRSLQQLPSDFSVAFYLVHSMTTSRNDFYEQEADAATKFIEFTDTTECEQIIYLGGMTSSAPLSQHLASRAHVAELLAKGKAALTSLGAAIIVGSGSASFEIIRDLAEKLPVMIAPRWLKTRCQPLAIRDAISFLTGVVGRADCYNEHFDIGGPDVLTYKEMLLTYAKARGLRRYILTVPVLTPRLSAYWLNLVTATPYRLAATLVNSMTTEVVTNDRRLQKMLPVEPIGYEEAIRRAFDKIEQNIVLSSWKDSLASGMEQSKISHYTEVPSFGCFKDEKSIPVKGDAEAVADRFFAIGGKTGWYYGGLLWKIRGLMDSAIGGVGLRRGRTNPTRLQPGDALDFWRVIVASRAQRRLLLFAEMKVPGEAWLEFKIVEEDSQTFFRQTATFRPRGISGRLYWYSMWLMHIFIFRGMARNIVKQSLS